MKKNFPNLQDSYISVDENVATLSLNRDDIRNALTGSSLIEDIKNTAEWVNSNLEISVLIITGVGKAFSAGGNIKEMRDRDGYGPFSGSVKEVEDKYRRGIQNIPKYINLIEVPTIAAVNGPAIGAGCDLACMCDIRIANEKAYFAESFINLGIVPGDGGAFFLQKIIGYQRAAEMTFLGKKVSAKEAFDIGLILKLSEGNNLQKDVMDLASQIAKKPSTALRYSKRLMKMASRMELNDFLDLSAVYQGVCHNDPEHIVAVEKLLDKKK